MVFIDRIVTGVLQTIDDFHKPAQSTPVEQAAPKAKSDDGQGAKRNRKKED